MAVKTVFRDYDNDVRAGVREFYRLNHRHQTLDFVLAKKKEYLPLAKRPGARSDQEGKPSVVAV